MTNSTKEIWAEQIWRTNHSPDEAERYLENGWWRKRTHIDDFFDAADAYPEKVAIAGYESGEEQPQYVTYEELRLYVDRCSCALVSMGLKKGDVVSIQLPNVWQFPILALSVMRIGAVVNSIPHIYRELEVGTMVGHARSKILFVPKNGGDFSYVDMAEDLHGKIGTLEKIFSVGMGRKGIGDFEGYFLEEPWEQNAELMAEVQRRETDANDAAVLLFTSGTTGTPKAAVHTYNTIWSAGRGIPKVLDLSSDDVVFMASTMGHLTGFYWGMLLPLSQGEKVVYQNIWDSIQMLDLIESEGITWTLSATPFAVDLIAAAKDKKARAEPLSLQSFKAFVCGGAKIPPDVAREFQNTLGVNLLSLWGCTEVGICSIHNLHSSIETLAASDGLPVETMELRIVDEEQKLVSDGDEGRLQVKGPGIFAGYLYQSHLTAELKTSDGWYDTGDMGKRTPDGGVRITGRSKDIIIRGGQNVPVVEIENLIVQLPEVEDVAVIGVPDDRLGERGCAVLVADEAKISLESVTSHLSASGMAKQFWPEYIKFVRDMPRTPAGKIKKFELRQRFSDVGKGE